MFSNKIEINKILTLWGLMKQDKEIIKIIVSVKNILFYLDILLQIHSFPASI